MADFFLSTFLVEWEDRKEMNQIQETFIEALKTHQLTFYNSFVHSSYEMIYNEKDNSAVFIAFVDEYWASSTWKMSELFYACGFSPENDNQYIPSKKSCFIYDTSNNVNIKMLFNRNFIIPFNGSFDEYMRISKTIKL